jgi:hypothetical protein
VRLLRNRGEEGDRLEEGGGPDRWTPPVGERRERKSLWAAGLRNSWAARGGKQAGRGERLGCWAELGKEVKGFGVCFFRPFSNLFKLNIFKILFKTFQIILKLLKLNTITHKHHASKT